MWGLPSLFKWWSWVDRDLLNVKVKFCFLMHLSRIFLEKLILLILLKPKSLFSLDMLRGNSKGQGWPLTFQPRSLILEVHQYIKTPFSQKPLGQLNSNFIWRLLKLSGVNLNQMVMVTWLTCPPLPYMVKTLYISSSLEPKGHWLWDLVCSIGDVGPTRFCANDESRLALTYFMTRSNLIPNAFIWRNFKMFIFL